MKYSILIVLSLVLWSCGPSEKKTLSAQEIVDKAIEVSGGEAHHSAQISFRFRNMEYAAEGKGNQRILKRMFDEDGAAVIDIKDSDKLARYKNDLPVQLSDSMAQIYANSVNSVHYFAKLPYGLNDKAVHKKLLGLEEIKGKTYHKIQVTFDQANGGEDFEDTYVYWIDLESFKPMYLAYDFIVDGGGVRFREAFNERYIDGVRFVDYKNYKPSQETTTVYTTAKQFEAGTLSVLSTIELEDIRVRRQ